MTAAPVVPLYQLLTVTFDGWRLQRGVAPVPPVLVQRSWFGTANGALPDEAQQRVIRHLPLGCCHVALAVTHHPSHPQHCARSCEYTCVHRIELTPPYIAGPRSRQPSHYHYGRGRTVTAKHKPLIPTAHRHTTAQLALTRAGMAHAPTTVTPADTPLYPQTAAQ